MLGFTSGPVELTISHIYYFYKNTLLSSPFPGSWSFKHSYVQNNSGNTRYLEPVSGLQGICPQLDPTVLESTSPVHEGTRNFVAYVVLRWLPSAVMAYVPKPHASSNFTLIYTSGVGELYFQNLFTTDLDFR